MIEQTIQEVAAMGRDIIFDLDGTLTDSGPGIRNTARAALSHFGIFPTQEQLRALIGPPLRQSFARLGVPEGEIENAFELYRSRYTTVGLFENEPYPGIRDLLARLRGQGHRLHVATSKAEDTALQILAHFGLTPYFDSIFGASVDRSRDTKSAVIACLLDQVADPAGALMVGDTAFDVIGAAAHGLPTIGVAWGYGTAAEMLEAGATAVAGDMEELFDLLNA